MGEQAFQCADLDSDAFHNYYKWLYHRTIPLQEDETPVDDAQRAGEECGDLLNAYLLGAQVQDKSFRTASLQALLEVIKENDVYPSPFHIRKVYRKTKPPSRIRKFLVEVHVSFGEYNWIQEDWEQYLAGFLADLSISLLRIRNVAENTGPEMAKLKERLELRSDPTNSDTD